MLKGKKRKTIAQFTFLILLLAVFLFVPQVQTAVKRVIFLFSMVDVGAMKGYILSFGIWAPIVSFLLMVFQSVLAPLPAFLITFANAALFGWVNGAILSWSSAMAGAALCYGISRFYGRDVVVRLVGATALSSVDTYFEKYGGNTIIIARLLPFVPFDPISYAAGLTSIKFWPFFLATGIGQLPATIIYSYAGDLLGGGAKTFVYGLLILFSLVALTALLRSLYTDKKAKR